MENISQTKSNTLLITTQPDRPLSKLQKQFNGFVQKIEKLKKDKHIAEKQLDQIKIRVLKDLLPLENKLVDKKVALVLLLDRHYSEVFFKAKELEKLQYLINKYCYMLIYQHGKQELKYIFDRHSSDGSFQNSNIAKDHIDFENETEGFFENSYSTKHDHKNTSKKIAKEARFIEETKNINKTARTIYTALVKEFHPDKELDESEKIRKNAIMHQITEAYEKSDLFKLLQLRLELSKEPKGNVVLPDEQVKYYNKILAAQAIELESELFAITQHPSFRRLGGSEKISEMNFTREVNILKQSIKGFDTELKLLMFKENVRFYLQNIELPA